MKDQCTALERLAELCVGVSSKKSENGRLSHVAVTRRGAKWVRVAKSQSIKAMHCILLDA